MPVSQPPVHVRDLEPEFVTIPMGTTLWRVQLDRFPSLFNPGPHVEPFGGGRFDSNQQNEYPFCYLAYDQDTALCERLLRSQPFSSHGGPRTVPYATVEGRTLRAVRTTDDIRLLGLRNAQELAKIYADEWLIQADPDHYPYTRSWAHWLRPLAEKAQGFIWPSRRNVESKIVILFGDRCEDAVDWHPTEPALDLDGDGLAELNHVLARYRASVDTDAHG